MMWGRMHVVRVIVLTGLCAAGANRAAGQESPRVVASADRVRMADASAPRLAVLDKTIAVDLDDVPLRDALASVVRDAGLRLSYAGDIGDLATGTHRVSARATSITVEQGLLLALQGTNLDAVVLPTGDVVIVRHGTRLPGVARLRQQATGSLTGQVTDAHAGHALSQVTVALTGMGYRALTDASGHYVIRNVPAGNYAVVARGLGYAAISRRVTVAADSVVRLDFALEPVAASLEQVVVTGAGPQRRIELGNSVATINADSVTRLAPVTDITDLLSGRAANVDIVSSTGIVGDGPAIRIRGRSSITATNDPIVFVDGVRTDSRPGGVRDVFTGAGNSPTPSALNDLSPNEIESIDILRGPSAATEYGTDAANGVIVIKTKRGQAGPPRWDFNTEQGISTMPAHFPLNYTSWGHTTDGTNTPTFCPTVNSFGGPGRFAHTCVVDSITTWQPLNHSETSLFANGGRHVYNLQFSEGTPRVRYFAAGDLSDELGVVRMPPSEQLRLVREQGAAIPGVERYPNAEQQVNLRGQATGTVGRTAEASISTAYLSTTQRAPDAANVLEGALLGPGYRDSLSGYSFAPPGDLFAVRSSGTTKRFTGGLSTTWHSAGWLSLRGTAGVDDSHRADETLVLPGGDASLLSFLPGGYRSTGRYSTGVYTVDVGAVASVPLGARVGSKTAAGVQYYDTRHTGSALAVTNIGIGNPTLNGGTVYQNSVLEQGDEEVTLGTYADETISIADQLYLTGAVRLDAGSGFGKQYNAAVYPKASLSWAIAQEPHNLLRLRAAYGQSGVQPQPGAALRLYGPARTYMGGSFVAGDTVATVGNSQLRPERSSEIEAGADVGFLRNRLTLELTGYVKTTTDALINAPLPGSLGANDLLTLIGAGTLPENLGEVRNRGIEVSLTGHPVDARILGWEFTLSGSVSDSKLITLGRGVLPIDATSFYAIAYRQEPGYPLYGLWGLPVHYRDLNHDGLIEPGEVSLGDSVTFQGSSLPTRQLALNTGLSLLDHHIRISSQVDYRGGWKVPNAVAFQHGAFANSSGGQALNSPAGVPLWEQARAVVLASTGSFRENSLTIEDASFTRWRELSVAYFVPAHLAAAVRARSASITLAVRNLALWTHYTGLDPEVSNQALQLTTAGLITPATNRDVITDTGALPLTRYWVLKLALGL